MMVEGALLHESEQAAQRATRSKNIIAEADYLVKLYFDAAHSLLGFAFTRSGLFLLQYNQATEDIRPQLQALRHEVRDEQELKLLAPIERLGKQNLDLLAKLEDVLKENNRADEIKAADLTLKKQTESSMGEFMAQMHRLIQYEREIQHTNPYGEESFRKTLEILLATGVVANIVLAFLLAFFFTSNVTKRLAVLTNNAFLLSADKPLTPIISGKDEIADLDRVFHRMAETLRLAQQKERAIITNAVDVICSIDWQGNFLTVSPSAKDIWGFAPEELIGMKFVQLLPDSDKKVTWQSLEALKEGVTIGRFENRLRRKDGSSGDMLWSVQRSDEDKSFFCIVQDISARKEIERMKQEFIAMVSHDIRSPLTGTTGFLEMLMDGVYGEISNRAKVRASSLQSGLTRLLSLVNNLLDLEKMGADKLSLNMASMSMTEIVISAVNALSGFAEQQDVKLKTAIAQDIEMLGDENRLTQVVLNLVSNAIKFSPTGGTVTVAVSIASGTVIEVRVTDEGRGVPIEFKEKIFERFQQVRNEDSRNQGGAGLGLSICQKIVELHGGTIGVDSPAVGSCFWFKLPCKRGQGSSL